MDIVRFDTTEEFVRAAAQWVGALLLKQAEANGSATLGVSGGSTPKPIYAMLAANQHLPWDKVKCFLLDERYVPVTHQDSNTRMITETLLTRSGADATLAAPDTSLPIDECVRSYGEVLAAYEKPDLAILGMGEDGHIASLFPPVSPSAFGPERVIHTQTDRFAVRDRISVTFPLLLGASHRLFLISGEAKAKLLQKMQDDAEDVSLYPAQYLFDERTTWFVAP